MKQFYVYILTNQRRGALYTGMTNDLGRRVWEHKEKAIEGFTKRYGVDQLVYFEVAATVDAAMAREAKLKRWRRDWKIKLIEQNNPQWIDLYPGITK